MEIIKLIFINKKNYITILYITHYKTYILKISNEDSLYKYYLFIQYLNVVRKAISDLKLNILDLFISLLLHVIRLHKENGALIR